jgi:hypothetical protein
VYAWMNLIENVKRNIFKETSKETAVFCLK